MRALLIIVLFIFSIKLKSQELLPSNVYVKTCINKTECSSINNAGYLFYDESKQAFYLKIDFNKFKTGNDSVDYWLNDLTETNLYLKSPFLLSSITNISNNHHKTYKLNSQVYLNGIWNTQSIELTLFSSENSIIAKNTSGLNLDNIKVNFSLNIIPKDFKVHKKAHHLSKVIFIGVALGRINLLQPGQQQLLGDAYNHN